MSTIETRSSSRLPELPARSNREGRLGFVLFLAAAFGISAAPAAEVRGEAFGPLEPCPGGPQGAFCGTLDVPETRAAPEEGTIGLRTMVFPALDETRRPDPLFILVGGPGQGAASIGGMVLGPLREIRRHRDLVLVDQRGTGASNPLACPLPEDPRDVFGGVFHAPTIEACRTAHRGANLESYTTFEAARDLEAVRKWLGYDRINLWGASYGTRLAQEYARSFPDSTRAIVLEGVSTFDHRSPLTYARDSQRALDRLFDQCAADPVCSQDFPELRHQFRVLLDRLRAGPVTTSIRIGGREEPVEVEFSWGDFGYAVRGMLYMNFLALQLPARIHQATTERDFSGFAQAYYDRAAGISAGLANGLYLSVICAEDVAFIEDGEIETWSEGTFLGGHLVHNYREACDAWGVGPVPRERLEAVSSTVPALILSGQRDPVTPASAGEKTLEAFPQGLHVVLPGRGHGVSQTSACARDLARAFLDAGRVDGLGGTCDDDEPGGTFNRKPGAASSR